MATIQFDNGQKVQFEGTPTEKDIEEVAQKLGITKKKSIARKVGDFFTSSSQKFGQTLGTAASVVDPKTKQLREEALASTNKMVDDYISRARTEPNKERAKKYLEAAQKLADTEDIDIFNNPEYQKTAKQILGEAAGTALEVLSFGTYGKGATAGLKSFKLGKAGLPTLARPILTKGKSILAASKMGAKYGSIFGGAFGASEAMMKDSSVGGIIQEGLIGAGIGGIFGGALGGGITAGSQGIAGLASRASKLSQKGRQIIGQKAYEQLVKTSRNLLKMSPTASKNEAKWNKNTPEFIANEFVTDSNTLKPKSILQLIDSDGNKIDTTEAVNALRNKYREESRAFNSLLQDSGEYASFNQLRDRTIRNVSDLKTQGSSYDDALKYINKEIDAYKIHYKQISLVSDGDVLIPISEMSKIKSGLWNKTSNFNPTQADKLLSDVNYRMGQVAKELIEENVQDVAVKRMNQRLGEMASAIRVLENAQGKVLPGGFFGKQFSRIAGTIAGTSAGIPGSIAGNLTGGMLADIMMNPKVKTSIWTSLYQQLGKTKQGQSIIDEAVKILKQRGETRAATKLLEAPKYIPLGQKADTSGLMSQEEATEYLKLINKIRSKSLPKGKGEILKTTPKTPLVSKTEQSLIKEAKKYKSADEFIKAQGEFIHETDASNIKEFTMDKIGSGQGEAWLGQGVYLQEKGTFKIEKYGKNKVEAGLSPEAKVFKVEDTPQGKWRDNFVEWYAKRHPELEKSLEKWEDPKNILPRDLLMNKGEYDFGTPTVIKELKDAGYDALLQDGELVVYNPKVLKTKSQLTDIWEKAQKLK